MAASMARVRRENSATRSGATPSTSRLATRPAMALVSAQATPKRSVMRSSTKPTWRSDRATTKGCRALPSKVRHTPSETVWARFQTTQW